MRRLVACCAALAFSASACGGTSARTTSAAGSTSTTEDMAGMAGMAGMPGMADHTDHLGRPTSSCSPSGPSLSITASDTKFDKDCLAAPASQPFTITYDNKDGIAHNLAILESHMASDVLFRAALIQGPTVQNLRVGALKPGTYAFHCEVHPAQMSGTFVVR